MARWGEFLPLWTKAVWGLHSQLCSSGKSLADTTKKPTRQNADWLIAIAIDGFSSASLMLFLRFLVWGFLFAWPQWFCLGHHATLLFFWLQRGNELLCIYLNSEIFPGLSWLGRGWLKDGGVWVGLFFCFYFFLDVSYASTWGRKEHCDVTDRGRILQAAVYCSGCLWGLHGYAN